MDKYSIWIRPDGKDLEKLRQIISQLAKKYDAPVFEPHITWVGDMKLTRDEAFAKAFEESTKLKPFTINLNGLGSTKNKYFRCVFLKSKTRLHLSLLYGDFDDKTKEKIIQNLGPLKFSIKVDKICLTNSSKDSKPKDWQVLAEFPLNTVESLKKGEVGVIPTDTIYGIVGSALNKKTVEKIYKMRKRSPEKPFITLISSLADLKKFGIKISEKEKKFLQKIWPNPVSVIVSGKAFRMPKDLWLRNLLKKVGPLVAPSANFEGEKPGETIEEAKKYFGDKVFYLDFGELKVKPSTLVELIGDEIKILRQGSYKI